MTRATTHMDANATSLAWIDTHCHLDASEFDADRQAVVERARHCGVRQLVIPAVRAADFERVRELAHEHGFVYALGLHPLYTPQARPEDLERLREALSLWRDDPRLVAVGEIGLDFFVRSIDAQLQTRYYEAQVEMAHSFKLPVLLHVRRSADALLKVLRRVRPPGGIAHAFNGSEQQAAAFIQLGFKLGFGGVLTFERALQIRRLATRLPVQALVLETDAPDMPPQWLYCTADERARGQFSRNEPAELARIAGELAQLRGLPLSELAAATWHNAHMALPRLAAFARS